MSVKRNHEQQSHVNCDCTYHLVIVPKYRKHILFQGIRKSIIEIVRNLSKRFDFEIISGSIGIDHIHIVLRIAPKYSVAEIVGKLKGKSAIIIHNQFAKKKKVSQKNFWSRGYFVSTVGIDLDIIKDYVKNQMNKDKLQDSNQLDFNW